MTDNENLRLLLWKLYEAGEYEALLKASLDLVDAWLEATDGIRLILSQAIEALNDN